MRTAAFTDDIRIPRQPWDERLHSMIARLKRGLFGKNTNKHWLVAAESLQNGRNQQKTARFKSWNLTGKLKGYLFQKTKLWEELRAGRTNSKIEKATKPKEETKSNQENGILCQNVNTRILFIKFYSSSYCFSLVCICSVEFKLLSVIVCTKLCVQLRARFCTLAQLLSKIM